MSERRRMARSGLVGCRVHTLHRQRRDEAIKQPPPEYLPYYYYEDEEIRDLAWLLPVFLVVPWLLVALTIWLVV